MIKKYMQLMLPITIGFVICSCTLNSSRSNPKDNMLSNKDKHVKVFYKKEKFAGWPANWGMWNWGDEILIGFAMADHKDRKGHTFDQKTAVSMFSRSRDGGLTWELEDAYSQGITEATFEHNVGEKSIEATILKEPIDFLHADFALTFRMHNLKDGPTSFYYTYDRGKSWKGAYELHVDFPDRRPSGIVSRTDYLIDAKHEMTAFLTVGFREGKTNWREVACVRTTDGGITWQFLAWISQREVNSIMPSSVRLGSDKILSIIRCTKPAEMVAFVSTDNGLSWSKLKNPVKVDNTGHPPTLLKLKDGRLSLIYGIRQSETASDGIGMYVVYSDDEGQTWTQPRQIRGRDGAIWDIGYPRSVELPDGKILAAYYYNNADLGDQYRYIAATIFDPK